MGKRPVNAGHWSAVLIRCKFWEHTYMRVPKIYTFSNNFTKLHFGNCISKNNDLGHIWPWSFFFTWKSRGSGQWSPFDFSVFEKLTSYPWPCLGVEPVEKSNALFVEGIVFGNGNLTLVGWVRTKIKLLSLFLIGGAWIWTEQSLKVHLQIKLLPYVRILSLLKFNNHHKKPFKLKCSLRKQKEISTWTWMGAIVCNAYCGKLFFIHNFAFIIRHFWMPLWKGHKFWLNMLCLE